jgi:hypothetical protein
MTRPKHPGRRAVGVNRLSNKKRGFQQSLLVEGLGDHILLDVMGRSKQWPGLRIASAAGRDGVYSSVAMSITDHSVHCIGLVDMDGYTPDDGLHEKKIKSASKGREDISPAILEQYVRDTRGFVCLISLLDDMLEGTWMNYFELGLAKRSGRYFSIGEEAWASIFNVARYRSWLHASKQVPKSRHPNALHAELVKWPEEVAFRKGVDSTGISFGNWLANVHRDSADWGGWNDHCLVASIYDYLKAQSTLEISLSKVEKMMMKSFKQALKSQKVSLDELLEEVGFVD